MSSEPSFDPKKILEDLEKCVLPPVETIVALCDAVQAILEKEENVLVLSTPITVFLHFFFIAHFSIIFCLHGDVLILPYYAGK